MGVLRPGPPVCREVKEITQLGSAVDLAAGVVEGEFVSEQTNGPACMQEGYASRSKRSMPAASTISRMSSSRPAS